MADWQRNINIAEDIKKFQDGESSVQALAQVIADKLKALAPLKGYDSINEELDEIVSDFESLAKDRTADLDDFDEVFSRLYDWGDIKLSGEFFDAKKVCWINVM